MRLWLDDVRKMPSGYTHWCKTSTEAIALIETNPNSLKAISFDHDLGTDCGEGWEVANAIERLAYEGKIAPLEWQIHSANPVGRQRIGAAMMQAEKFWRRRAYTSQCV